MRIERREVEYRHNGDVLEGVLAFEKGFSRPAVLVFHGMGGRSEAEIEFAKKLAEWGYVGFAADLYGKSMTGVDSGECQKLMMSFMENQKMLQRRLLHILGVVKGWAKSKGIELLRVDFVSGACVLWTSHVQVLTCEASQFFMAS